MVILVSFLATALLVPAISAAPAESAVASTCKAVAVVPCVTKLRAYTSANAFCTSWLSISTLTSTSTTTSATTSTETSTVTSTTATTTVPAAETVTVLAHGVSVIGHAVSETVIAHATTDWAPTPTVVAHVSFTTITTTLTSTICGNAKRAAPTIPSVLQGFKSSIISSACSCLPLTTPSTTVTTTASSTGSTTSTETLQVVATETTTATITSTWVTTSIPTLTTIVTPTTTLTPDPVTSTPVSTAIQTETKTVRVGQAAVQLTSPTPITPVRNGVATSNYDDNTGWRINNIPFDVGLYGVTSRTLIVGINGWISPGSTDSGTYVNQPLPNSQAGDPSWVAYWADLFISSGTAQGIYYQIDGDEGHRTLSIEFFMSFFGASSAYTHFMITLFEDEIGRVVFSYFQTTSQKASTNSAYGTIGVQRPATGQFNQYSYNVQPREGLTIEWRPSTNQWRDVSTGTC